MSMPNATGICAVIVTFRPDSALSQRLIHLARDVDHVIIIDNGADPTIEALAASAIGLNKVTVHINGTNRGLAAALNQGIAEAAGLGWGQVLLLDQDTELLAGCVEILRSARRRAERLFGDKVLIGADYWDGPPSLRLKPFGAFVTVSVKRLFSAGMLLPSDILQRVGPHREDLFIDLVDVEFCHRAAAQGWQILTVRPPLIIQSLGSTASTKILGRTFKIRHYPPERHYYRYRNFVALAREGALDSRFIRGQGLYLLRAALLMLVFERARARKLLAIFRGLSDGLRHRLGPMPQCQF